LRSRIDRNRYQFGQCDLDRYPLAPAAHSHGWRQQQPDLGFSFKI